MRRIFLIFVVVLSIAALAATSVRAQEFSRETFKEGLDAFTNNGQVSAPVTVAEITNDDISAKGCLLLDDGHCSKALTGGGTGSLMNQNTVFGKVSGTIAQIYTTPPANTKMYMAYMRSKMGLVVPAYAQGVGFSGLSPILPLWQVFRNVAYGFLIIVMIFVGFMVMFRMKIDPRTVISVQAALPRIITTVIFITFSYAIVGLLIDLMYVMIFLMVTTIGSTGLIDVQQGYAQLSGGSASALFKAVFTTGASATDELTNILGGGALSAVTYIAMGVGAAFAPVTLLATAPLALASYGAGSNPIVYLLVAIALVFTFIRLLLTLINAYINVIISVIFGPIQLMLGAIPNNNAFSSWFRGLVANLAVFPITMGVLLLAQLLSQITSTSQIWKPPGLAGSVGGAVGSGVTGLVALGLVFTIPNIVAAVKEALKVKPMIPTGAGAVMSPITSVYGTAMTGASQMYYLKQMMGGGHGEKGGILSALMKGGIGGKK